MKDEIKKDPQGKIIIGHWTENDIRRVFVAGAKWWEFHSRKATMWNSDVRLAENEATKRYGEFKRYE